MSPPPALIARRPEVAAPGLDALREPVRIGEHERAAKAAVELRSVGRIPLALDQDPVIAPMRADGALEARVVIAAFLPDPHANSLSNDRSIGNCPGPSTILRTTETPAVAAESTLSDPLRAWLIPWIDPASS